MGGSPMKASLTNIVVALQHQSTLFLPFRAIEVCVVLFPPLGGSWCACFPLFTAFFVVSIAMLFPLIDNSLVPFRDVRKHPHLMRCLGDGTAVVATAQTLPNVDQYAVRLLPPADACLLVLTINLTDGLWRLLVANVKGHWLTCCLVLPRIHYTTQDYVLQYLTIQ